MDRKGRRRVGNRNRTTNTKTTGASQRRANRRTALANRRNRRQGLRRNRNRLARAQNNLRTGRRGPSRRFRRFNNFRSRRNLRLRIVFVGGLPNDVDNRRLYSLFRNEGRIIGCKWYLTEWVFQKDMDLLNFRIQDLLGELFKNGIILI